MNLRLADADFRRIADQQSEGLAKPHGLRCDQKVQEPVAIAVTILDYIRDAGTRSVACHCARRDLCEGAVSVLVPPSRVCLARRAEKGQF
jgi:hypothetical protein